MYSSRVCLSTSFCIFRTFASLFLPWLLFALWFGTWLEIDWRRLQNSFWKSESKRTWSYLQCDRGPDWGLIEHRHPFQTNQSDNQELQQQILDILNTIQFKKYFRNKILDILNIIQFKKYFRNKILDMLNIYLKCYS